MEDYTGTIQPFSFSFAPRGWASCDGQLIQISQNTALFSLVGVTYGGDGRTTFALPDLRGRRIVHKGQQPGGDSYDMGEVGGATTATLTANNLPSHTHALQAAAANANLTSPSGAYLAQPTGTDESGGAVHVLGFVPSGALSAMGPQSIGATGQSSPFSVLDPYLVFNVCICLQGYFPQRP